MKKYYHGPYFVKVESAVVSLGVTDAAGQDHARFNPVPVEELKLPNARTEEGLVDPSREVCRKALRLARIEL